MDDKILSRDEILKTEDKTIELVPVPEWGGSVYVRVVAGWERDNLEELVGKHGMANFRGRFASLVVCNKDGKQIFTAADIDALGKKSAAALDRVFDVGRRLNRMTSDDVKELEKNSEAAQSGGNGSD